MSGDPECCTGTYEGHTLLPALGRKPSTLATPAEFPTAMLSHARHLASAKGGWAPGGGRRGQQGEEEPIFTEVSSMCLFTPDDIAMNRPHFQHGSAPRPSSRYCCRDDDSLGKNEELISVER